MRTFMRSRSRILVLAIVLGVAACSSGGSGEAAEVQSSLESQGVPTESCELYHDVQQLYRCQLSDPVDGDTDWCALFDSDSGKASLVAPYRIAHEDCQ